MRHALFLILLPALFQSATAQTRIMPLGDSITQGDIFHASYRYWLWLDLHKAGYDVDFVGSTSMQRGGRALFRDFDHDHEGHWGWRADEVLSKLRAWTTAAKPDVVLTHLGHNDVFQGEGVTNALDDLEAIVKTLRAANPSLTILIAQVIPSREMPEIDQLSAAIPALAAKLDSTNSAVRAIDLWTDFSSKADTYDGVHPNESGEKKMAARWFEALKLILPPPRMSAP